MSTFKYKPRKNYKGGTVMTLDMKHNAIAQQFTNDRANLPKKKKQVIKLERELNKLEEKKEEFTNDDIRQRAKLKNQIEDLQKEIANIENNQEERREESINKYKGTARKELHQ